jgi:tyrosyl-tRNA synthetase
LNEIKAKEGSALIDVLIENKLIDSKSEARRLFDVGAVDINGQTVQDIKFLIQENVVVKIGKKTFVKITVN